MKRIRLTGPQIHCLKHAVICGRIFDNGHPQWRAVLALERRGLLERITPGRSSLHITGEGLLQLRLNDRIGWERVANGRPMAVEFKAGATINLGDMLSLGADRRVYPVSPEHPVAFGKQARAQYGYGDSIIFSSLNENGYDIAEDQGDSHETR